MVKTGYSDSPLFRVFSGKLADRILGIARILGT